MKKGNFLVPILIVVIVIFIIFYLIANTNQPNVICEMSKSNDLNIETQEKINVKLSSRKITELNIKKEYIFPKKIADEANLKMLKDLLDNSLEYLGDDQNVYIKDNKVIVNIITTKKKPVLLDNVEFISNEGLSIKVNTNTKSDVTNLSVGEEYSEGKLLSYLKSRGYDCK
ncbi:MAG: hypothetical protein IJL76_03835 [Bacilli bacterium]|nr:hypothetical protein [Bacilli bacterium]